MTLGAEAGKSFCPLVIEHREMKREDSQAAVA